MPHTNSLRTNGSHIKLWCLDLPSLTCKDVSSCKVQLANNANSSTFLSSHGPLRLTCSAAASTVDRRSLLATAAAWSYVAGSPQQAQAALPAPTQTLSLGGGVEMPTLALNTVGLSVDNTSAL